MKVLGLLVFLGAAGGTLLVRTPPPAPEPQAQPDKDAATLKGSVKIKGPLPRRSRIRAEADPKCAALHSKDPLFSDEVVADAAGHVQWALVVVKEGLGDQKFAVPKTPVLVEQKGCRFEPHVFGVMAGQEVKFRNNDPLMHIVHVVPNQNKEFGFSQEKVGEERIKIFDKKETIKVICDVHPWMTAWAVVLDHPFHAVTGPDGKFTMKNLPPGKYTLEVWHEKYKAVTQEIEVKAKETKTLAFELTETK